MNRLVSEVRKLYAESFGAQPEIVARAPGRVEVLGNHTDYNEGYVLSCAIDREICVAVGPGRGEGTIELVSSQFPAPVVVPKAEKRRDPAWVNYPLGVYHFLTERGMRAGSVRIAVHGNVPLGAGLSSSAALEVSTALALCAYARFPLEPAELARICQKAEHEFAGSKCGLLDQFSSLFGKKDHLLFIDFRTLEYKAVAMPDEPLSLVLSISGVTHSLVESAYNDRRRECGEAAKFFADRMPGVRTLRDINSSTLLSSEGELDPLYLRRAGHIVGENERVLGAMLLLANRDLEGFGRFMFESHESSRVNFENSCPELDALVEIARGCPGVFGSRLSGGGFGGATLTLVREGDAAQFVRSVTDRYREKTGRNAVIHTARSADGASIIR